MTDTPIIMHEQQYQQLGHILNKLRLESFSRVVFLVDKNGQQIAVHGDVGNMDTTSLASLAAGNVAATGGMAQLIGEKEFPTLSHEGELERITRERRDREEALFAEITDDDIDSLFN